ncbi:MAG TPA: hypothetical protein VNE62_05035 [Actinomycetota bacterium]|nr:hypothetical protein [Actinomycetota bacterium]
MTRRLPTREEILQDGYLSGLEARPVEELRLMLEDSRREEGALSYVRRWLHGKLDVLRSELAHRGEASGSRSSIQDRLTSALASGAQGGSRGARSKMPSDAQQAEGQRMVDELLAEVNLARLPDMGADDIDAAADRLVETERAVSGQRRALLSVIDALESELVRRYRDGLAVP